MQHDHLLATVEWLQNRTTFRPEIAIILGSGLGAAAKDFELSDQIPFKEIPHFQQSTAPGHQGAMLFGHLHGRQVVFLSGRLHYYEGYSLREATFPVRVLCKLGIQALIITNAAGGIHPDYRAGDLVLIRDHINMMPDNPLRGPNDERLGPRFPDMLNAYDATLREMVKTSAAQSGIQLHQGVYVALPGPNLETPAEYLAMHRLGADLVGMSTVPEVLVARHMGIKVLALSLVANQCYPIEQIKPTTADDVLQVAAAGVPKLEKVLEIAVKALD